MFVTLLSAGWHRGSSPAACVLSGPQQPDSCDLFQMPFVFTRPAGWSSGWEICSSFVSPHNEPNRAALTGTAGTDPRDICWLGCSTPKVKVSPSPPRLPLLLAHGVSAPESPSRGRGRLASPLLPWSSELPLPWPRAESGGECVTHGGLSELGRVLSWPQTSWEWAEARSPDSILLPHPAVPELAAHTALPHAGWTMVASGILRPPA